MNDANFLRWPARRQSLRSHLERQRLKRLRLDRQASHQNSLSLPAVQAAIAKGRPMIAGFSNRVETVPLGGYGLPKPPQR